MTSIIGLPSGKEFIVRDGYYPFIHKITKAETQIFISADSKRMITVPPKDSPVEFYEEPADEKMINALEHPAQPIKEVTKFNDPNIR